jgi:hypothetical protein
MALELPRGPVSSPKTLCATKDVYFSAWKRSVADLWCEIVGLFKVCPLLKITLPKVPDVHHKTPTDTKGTILPNQWLVRHLSSPRCMQWRTSIVSTQQSNINQLALDGTLHMLSSR